VVDEGGYLEELSGERRSRLVVDAIQESLTGLLSRRRVEARAQGLVGSHVLLRVSLKVLSRLVKARIDGLRGDYEGSEGLDAPSGTADDNVVQALTIDSPSPEDLRRRWLPKLGVRVDNDVAILDVEVPPPRRAHSR
jgi:hypothetical protein